MNISFDLDGTLIPYNNEFETESRNRFAAMVGIEKIRKSSPQLIKELQKKGHTINIYTTSFRKKIKIRITLGYYGIHVKKIINQKQNIKTLNELKINASKYPRAYNFHLHIDDSKGVKTESETFNFKMILIQPTDINWTKTIMQNIKLLNTIE